MRQNNTKLAVLFCLMTLVLTEDWRLACGIKFLSEGSLLDPPSTHVPEGCACVFPVVQHCVGLLLGTEAPVMTPNSVDFSFSFPLQHWC